MVSQKVSKAIGELSCAFCRTGEQDYSIALRIVEYLKHEKEYIPWKSALDNLSSVNRILRRSAQYGLFKVSLYQLSLLNILDNP